MGNPDTERHPPEDLEGWRHYADTGRKDKETMLQVEIWLFGLSTAIIYFVFKNGVDGRTVVQPLAVLAMAGMGVGVAGAAGFIALLYGGYAKKNWDHADEIARENNWSHLIPAGVEGSAWKETQALSGLAGRAWKWSHARPDRLARIFYFFFVFALCSGGIQAVLFVWGLITVLGS